MDLWRNYNNLVDKFFGPCIAAVHKAGGISEVRYSALAECISTGIAVRLVLLIGMLLGTIRISRAVKKREQKDKKLTTLVIGASAAVIVSAVAIAITAKCISDGIPKGESENPTSRKSKLGMTELVLVSAFCAAAISGRKSLPNDTSGPPYVSASPTLPCDYYDMN